MTTKVCRSCKQVKHIDEFFRNGAADRMADCKYCYHYRPQAERDAKKQFTSSDKEFFNLVKQTWNSLSG